MRRKQSSRLPREVFLSHSSRNRTFVNKLASVLREHGVPVWHSETNIVGAQQWHDEIGKALSRCDWFALVLSPSAVSSKWVKHEVLRALRDSRYDDRIVPILYRPCDSDKLSWTLNAMQTDDWSLLTRRMQNWAELCIIWVTGTLPWPTSGLGNSIDLNECLCTADAFYLVPGLCPGTQRPEAPPPLGVYGSWTVSEGRKWRRSLCSIA